MVDPVFAAYPPPNLTDTNESYVHTVLPGETLVSIAERYGSSVHTLLERNGLQSPAQIYPQQALYVAPAWMVTKKGISHEKLHWGKSLLDISHLSAVEWQKLALANRLLHPGTPIPGYNLVYPSPVFETTGIQLLTPSTILAAIRYQRPLWSVLYTNPYPVIEGESMRIPVDDSFSRSKVLPFPVLDVSLGTQPFIRGAAAQVTLLTSEPVTCSLHLLDQQAPCFSDPVNENGSVVNLVFVGLSPVLEPGQYTATLMIIIQDENTLELPLPFFVAAGRYDYERIDLPPDRQSLLDPALSQAERNKIASLRTVQTQDRFWVLPFDLPLEGSVTSYYGSRRSYGYGFTSFHAGTDFRATVGVPVSAPEAGTVVLAEKLVVRGNAVIIDHGWGVLSGYWHLSRIDVEVGTVIERGDNIGAVGNTGLSTGPHLHWEMWVHGVPVSPLEWIDGGSMQSLEN